MRTLRTYISLAVVVPIMAFVIGCSPLVSVNTIATRTNCGEQTGVITVDKINTFTNSFTAAGALANGYAIDYYSLNTHLGSGASIGNLDGNEMVKILVTPPGSFGVGYFREPMYNPSSAIQQFNTHFNNNNNQLTYDGSTIATWAYGQAVFSNVLPPQTNGTIEIGNVSFASGGNCGTSTFGFADNVSLLPSTACYDFRVEFHPAAPCGLGAGYAYYLFLYLGANQVGILGCSGADYIDIARTTDVNGNWVYQVSKSGSLQLSVPAPNSGGKTLTPVARIFKDEKITFTDIAFDFCTSTPPVYAELKKELDASFQPISGTLAFKYKEKYNDGSLKYKVYDWQRNVVVDNTQISYNSLQVGDNYIQLDLSRVWLPASRYYVMEVTDKKGEVYKLRFKYR